MTETSGNTQTDKGDGGEQTNHTKAYSDLHNQFKEFKTQVEARETEYKNTIAQLQGKADGAKDAETLQAELNQYRTQNESLSGELTNYKTNLSEMLKAQTAGLNEDQKKLVEFSDPDPFKRMQFINQLKGQKSMKTSQGGAVVDDGGEPTLDVTSIVRASNMGNNKPYREACTKWGEAKVDEIIARETAVGAGSMTSNKQEESKV